MSLISHRSLVHGLHTRIFSHFLLPVCMHSRCIAATAAATAAATTPAAGTKMAPPPQPGASAAPQSSSSSSSSSKVGDKVMGPQKVAAWVKLTKDEAGDAREATDRWIKGIIATNPPSMTSLSAANHAHNNGTLIEQIMQKLSRKQQHLNPNNNKECSKCNNAEPTNIPLKGFRV